MDVSGWIAVVDAGDFTIAREIIMRGVAALFFLAFLSGFFQFPALLGEHGLSPAPAFIRRTSWRQGPSLFRWRFTPYSDRLLRLVCAAGMVLAASAVIGIPQLGPAWAPIPVFLAMWGLYLSIVSIGQRFYGFGWEMMLLEAGFVAGFLGSNAVAPPAPILLFLCWMVFRVEFGAGMIKWRGDPQWRDLTAMDFHHQTQPMPGPLSRWAHLRPGWWHKGETAANFAVQLGAPFLLFLPQPIATFGALAIIVSQFALVVTGNYAWLNWLTIILATAAISDSTLAWIAGGPWPGLSWFGIEPHTVEGAAASPLWWAVGITVVFVWMLVLSREPLLNLLSPHQRMNASFNVFKLVNAYGAFGSMTRVRRELIIEGTMLEDPTESDWLPYEFKGKPGDVYRTPRQFAPYHLRLDWVMWFAALGAYREQWFRALLVRLAQGDPGIRRLLRIDPYDGEAPALLRVRVFEYRYATPVERNETGRYWTRELQGTLVRPSSLDDLKPIGA